MELSEFAAQVLFGRSLEEKLQSPGLITDERPGLPVPPPANPGRPVQLQFRPAGTRKPDFPGLHSLARERERGRLLHFFANHELLACELMALVLLRFPQAPAAFRRGVLQTLKDEQRHTRLYIRRLHECGVEFGELPVSGYFWRALAGMESPMDYVAGLSLTFEQANLDFARHYGRAFERVGDAESAQLLKGIYHDEIGHVAYGLKWFRRWKNPEESDWEAFCQQLKFPLSPQRAKGFSLNIDGRRAAGLEASFIDELNVYSQSKGRTPAVYLFNPLAEGRLAYGKSFAPVKTQLQLVQDLETLPQFLGRQDDVVLVEQMPSVEFLSRLKETGFGLPQFIALKESRVDLSHGLAQRKLGALRPWAWAPDSVELLEPLMSKVTGEPRGASQYFNEGVARLYSKVFASQLLRKLLARCPDTAWLCSEAEVGMAAGTLEEALAALAAIRERGHHRVIVKEAIGLAGRNAIRLWEPELLETQRRWLGRSVQNSRQVIVEPWLEREVDFSVQLEMRAEGLKLCGYTGLLNDLKGQYQGNWAAPGFERRPPAEVTARFREPENFPEQLKRLYAELFELIEQELRTVEYLGPLGIDAFVYRTAQGHLRIKPLVELNPRYTMGRLTLELMRHTCPGSHGLLRLVSRSLAQAEGLDSFPAYAQWLEANFPVVLEGEPVRKIKEGAICLTDPARAQVCLATFRVSRTGDGQVVASAG